ncbi:MAG: 3-hydroxyacyl-CoA dehydrogenase family protein [Syntrophobacteraceae bacterium]
MKINNIAIIGSGIMGSGVAQVSAAAGFGVKVQDIRSEALQKAKSSIEFSLGKLASKGKMTQEQVEETLSKIEFCKELEQAADGSDLIIEAVFENLAIKHEIFRKLDRMAGPDTILASNTSALPITEITGVTNRAEKCVGIHFMNPVPLMKGVEIIRGQLTSDETFEAARDYVVKLGKEPIEAIDFAGFIVSRLLDVLMNETIKLVQEGNRPEDIDKAMELCAGHPMGPCKLLDLVGAEIAMHGMETMERDMGPAYKPHPLLKKRVLAGLLGKKTGQGFYKY